MKCNFQESLAVGYCGFPVQDITKHACAQDGIACSCLFHIPVILECGTYPVTLGYLHTTQVCCIGGGKSLCGWGQCMPHWRTGQEREFINSLIVYICSLNVRVVNIELLWLGVIEEVNGNSLSMDMHTQLIVILLAPNL